MRIALLGDIHGNASAWSAVIDGAQRENAEMLLLTGDFVGYYYQPEIALRALAEWPYYAVRGNHEDMLFASLDNSAHAERYRTRYGSGLDVALASLSRDELSQLKTLPVTQDLTIAGKRFLLGHGAPWDTDCYIYPDAGDEVWKRLATYGHEYIVLGHTHHRYSKRIGNTLVINPGSVGQPRDRRPGAAWALLDTEKDTVDFFIEDYDMSRLAAEARARDPHLPYLAEVLTRQ
jgi:putative phosphoesterase